MFSGRLSSGSRPVPTPCWWRPNAEATVHGWSWDPVEGVFAFFDTEKHMHVSMRWVYISTPVFASTCHTYAYTHHEALLPITIENGLELFSLIASLHLQMCGQPLSRNIALTTHFPCFLPFCFSSFFILPLPLILATYCFLHFPHLLNSRRLLLLLLLLLLLSLSLSVFLHLCPPPPPPSLSLLLHTQASTPSDVPPVIVTPHHYLISIYRSDIYFVAVVQHEGMGSTRKRSVLSLYYLGSRATGLPHWITVGAVPY